ncbi:MAG: restriction endonuclease subunit S [Methanobrevibacter sp.]|jgi:type I restriction enzyme S subunit|nr:restriction endonuclease subunit S [Candidatus Methanovirga procula]
MNNNLQTQNLMKYVDIVNSGVTEFKGEKKYIATGSLETDNIIDNVNVAYNSRPSRANMEFKVNDVIFAKMKDTEKVFLIDKDTSENLYSTGFAGLRIKNSANLIPKFLYFYIRSSTFQKEKDRKSGGATQKAINNTKIKEFTLPVPHLETQKQIVAILEKAEKLKEHRQIADDLTNSYLKSIFFEMFGDPVKNSKNWDLKLLSKIANVNMGQSPPGDSYNEICEGVPFFQGKAEFQEKYPIVKKYTTKPKKFAEIGDILMSVRAPVGSVNVSNIDCSIGRGLCAINCVNINLEYLYYHFKLIEGSFENMGTGSTFKSINKAQLENLKIPYPPIELQDKFAKIVERLEKVKDYQRQSKIEIDNLFNNLMQKSFRGELFL